MNPVRLLIATPMYAGQAYGYYMRSVMELNKAVTERGWQCSQTFHSDSLITRGRNVLAKVFLGTNCTHMLFLDSDIHFRADQIIRMIEADLPLICGVYPKKEINWRGVEAAVKQGVPWQNLRYYTGAMVVNMLPETMAALAPGASPEMPVNEPFEVLYAGTGCMLIRRDVLHNLIPHVPKYINDVLDTDGRNQPEEIYQFFAEHIDGERLLSEDWEFCRRHRAIGGKVYIAPWVQLAHIGTYTFEGTLIPKPNA